MGIGRASAALLLLGLTAPLQAQPAVGENPVQDALSVISSHAVGKRIGCPVPIPALWNAPPYEQHAAARRRSAFQDCLADAFEREQQQLSLLSEQIDRERAEAPELDWSGVESALESKWSELESFEQRLRTRERWADTATNVLDTFTGPGAPFGPKAPAPGWGGPYRRDSSVSAMGIR